MEKKQINRVIQIKTTTAKFIPVADRKMDRQIDRESELGQAGTSGQ